MGGVAGQRIDRSRRRDVVASEIRKESYISD